MKVYIGPYCNWFGPYQLADKARYLGVNEDTCHKFGDILAESWIGTFLEWVHSKKKRKIKVRIDNYDVWSADHTLALIILPILKKLRVEKNGAPYTDDEDVPEELRSTNAKKKENDWDTDSNHFDRWNYIMDEMIWTFEHIVNDDWEDEFHHGEAKIEFMENKENGLVQLKQTNPGYYFDKDECNKVHARIDNGLRLFGKYYRGLWD